MLSKAKEVDAKLMEILCGDSGTIAIVCGGKGGSGRGSILAQPVRKLIKNTLENFCERDSPMLLPKKAIIVDSRWIIESVTCAKAMPPDLFEPAILKDLWKLCLM